MGQDQLADHAQPADMAEGQGGALPALPRVEGRPELPGDGVEQLDMFALRTASLPVETAESLKPAFGSRGAGRPKGAANKRNDVVRDWLLAKGYAHPLEVLAAIYSQPAGALAQAMHCKHKEALDMQIRAAREALPYFEARKIAVEGRNGEALPVFNVTFGSHGGRPGDGPLVDVILPTLQGTAAKEKTTGKQLLTEIQS